ncbi:MULTISPECIES: phosphatidylglycerophosphatase A [unclassified Paenibacillus]|uniref:phosphatidylglycerophosphatase A family protein n=1 Tax=unclassified Paenibacillus TaxID=185978 RepID=UPI00095588CE|nr:MULTISPECIES: phosphatidylglycerophosphatase A [unclassified Paenibacillus]ASS66410.1 phosphatidylglycerophosphatase A [Paenibacillus sp. RUD330]SIQ05193.1 Phosphatidylglycerophosphatase A [Paenibacillus sp. RU4X]SIQ25340.1 Phosphatidylglycerophosphatase A [Paenibacillus sp. RU4T]
MSDPGTYALNSRAVAEATAVWLEKRGVNKTQIAELALFLQKDYYPDLSLAECEENVDAVLAKREVQNAILTGIQLDVLAEEGKLIPPLQDMIGNDEGLYGCDEILALSIVNVYGSIGLTNFGYIDKLKPGILVRLNDKNDGQIHTFLDDIVGAIAASAASRIAHRKQAQREIDRDEHSDEVPLA